MLIIAGFEKISLFIKRLKMTVISPDFFV